MYSVDKNNEILKRLESYIPEKACLLYDGVCNVTEYEKANPKILFILKEMNNDKANYQKTANIAENIGKYYNPEDIHTYGNIAKIINNYFHKDTVNFNNYNESKKRVLELLSKIAIINVNKFSTGKVVSKDTEIEKYIQTNSKLLEDQIINIDPDIIFICTGSQQSWKELYKILHITDSEGTVDKEWIENSKPIPIEKSNQGMMKWSNGKKTVYCICHPSYSELMKWIAHIDY